MKKKRRLKKGVEKIFLAIVIGIILFIWIISSIVKRINYTHSYEYKLLKIGYSKQEVEVIDKLNNKQKDSLLNKKYNKLYVKLIKQKYFIFKNLDKYVKYYIDNDSDDLAYTISIVNVKANEEQYDKDIVKKTNTSKDILMLVNKYNYLDKDSTPKDLVDVKNYYAYGENKIRQEVYDNFLNMWTDAKKEELSLIITSAYRDYDYQKSLWDMYSNQKGDAWADSIAARAGYSEHQTGLALDIVTYGSNMDTFENTDEFKWLSENAYKYGFILRYPKGKEKLTGYSYESWHYRYVGKEVAKKIHDLDITYDEYYAYFIEK